MTRTLGIALALVVLGGCGTSPSIPLDAGADAAVLLDGGAREDMRPCTPDLIAGPYFVTCGSDGVTYGYWELAWCRYLTWTPGACDPVACSMGETGPPVCGQDGKTYAGDRTAGCHGVLKARDGACP